jgi:glutamyl-tRNA synthetase
MRIRTRFAPSPTGFIHLGNLRSALYPWAFARSKGGDFILRIEDTDQERSSLEAVEVILEGMHWLEMDPDEGPIYQMQHMDRYREVLKQMLADGSAYYCYMSEDELNRLRDEQMANKQKPRYNGFWRPESGKTLPTPPKDVNPVIRFKNPIGGSVIWNDAVKGMIEISNEELDDLIIARPDGTPTYNFCVVVDDLDMKITHVIRGDDHVNNTPRQINIMKSLGGTPPVYAHLPTVLDESGEKMSKRNGALSVRDYQKMGYLPEAILNYLARLGWSHGDVEIFSKDQFIGWFDLEHLGRSPAQHNPEKLLWLNHHYIQNGDPKRLAQLCKPFAEQQSINIAQGPNFEAVVALLKDRANTLLEIVEGAKLFYQERPQLSEQQIQENIPENVRPAITEFREALKTQEAQSKEQVGALLKTILTQHNLKMPALAMPIRYALFATTQTPALDAVIAVLGKEEVIERLAKIG